MIAEIAVAGILSRPRCSQWRCETNHTVDMADFDQFDRVNVADQAGHESVHFNKRVMIMPLIVIQ